MPKFEPVTGKVGLWRRDWYDVAAQAYQDCDNATPAGECKVALTDGRLIKAAVNTSTVVAGGSVAAWENIKTLAVEDSLGRSWPAAGLSQFGASPDGAYALKVLRNSYGPWDVVEIDGSRWQLTGWDAHNIQLLGDRKAIFMVGVDDFCTPGLPVAFPVEHHYGARAAWIPEWNRYILVYQRASDGALVCDNHVIAPPSDHYYYLDIEYRAGVVRITWSTSQADNDAQYITLTLADLVALPLSVVPFVPPPVDVKPLPRKMWVSPFFSHSERYGDTPIADHVGNAITVVSGDGSLTSLLSELTRIKKYGQPMIVQGDLGPVPSEYLDQTIAWWVSAVTMADLQARTQKALAQPEKPVIAYLDGRGWPASKPAFITERVWPSVQMYRKPGESLISFGAVMDQVLTNVQAYGKYIVLTPRFDNFNGAGSLQQTLEAMPLYNEAVRHYSVVGFMPFSDRRGLAAGLDCIAKTPELKQWAKAFLEATPSRPNRFDYWTPSGDLASAIRNKLMQTTETIVLLPAEKKYILDRLK